MVINVSSLTMGCGARAQSARMALKKRTNSKSHQIHDLSALAPFTLYNGTIVFAARFSLLDDAICLASTWVHTNSFVAYEICSKIIYD